MSVSISLNSGDFCGTIVSRSAARIKAEEHSFTEITRPEDIRISMCEVVGSPFCVASDDGEKIHKHLDAALRANQEVVLSFHNVTALTTPFLTAAIGELYGTFSEEKKFGLY